jgi:uncharacterized protein (TIGR02058 family)
MTGKAMKRIMLEMGTGNALHSKDYTKAAIRAIEDAMHHSSLTVFRSLNIDPSTAEIELTLAAQEPEKIDLGAVIKALPFGKLNPKAVKGGLNVTDETTGEPVVIVNAGIVVRVPI